MRTLIITIISSVLLFGQSLYGYTTYTYTVRNIHQETLMQQVDRIIDVRYASLSSYERVSALENILTRIDRIQKRNSYSQETGALLSYVELQITHLLEQARTQSRYDRYPDYPNYNYSYSRNLEQRLSVPSYIESSYSIPWGGNSWLIRRLDLGVNREPIILNELTFRSSRDELSSYIWLVWLYDDQGYLIATATPDYDEIVFTNLDLYLEQRAHELYIGFTTYRVDDRPTEDPYTFTLRLADVDAEGYYSRDQISPTQYTTTSPQITLTSAIIESLRFVTDRNGYRTSTSLSESSDQTLGILEIVAGRQDNTYRDDIILDELIITVTDDTVAKTIASSLRLSRLDSRSDPLRWSVQGNTVRFNLNNLNNQRNWIAQGQTAYFKITAQPDLDPYNRESAQLSIRNIDNGWIVYHTENSTTSLSTVQQTANDIWAERISD